MLRLLVTIRAHAPPEAVTQKEIMKSWKLGLLSAVMLLAVGVALVGCGGEDSVVVVSAGTPATNLNVNGFWENPLNGETAAGDMWQTNANVTAYLLLPPMGMGRLVGTVDGYHLEYTIAWDSGSSSSGSGDFAFVNTGVDKLIFTSSLPSVGPFTISWRGPSFAEHSPAEVTLNYTPSAPTW